jgi:hypothetical protein
MYSIVGLCPNRENPMGGYGFSIKLWPLFREMVASYPHNDQLSINKAIDTMGREWLDACGYSQIFDPNNCGVDANPKKKPGPKSRPAYQPNRDLRVQWGEWGPEHITVPGDACGLDIDQGLYSPHDGRILAPHNVDNWRQVQLLLITFCWFADDIMLNWEIKQLAKLWEI